METGGESSTLEEYSWRGCNSVVEEYALHARVQGRPSSYLQLIEYKVTRLQKTFCPKCWQATVNHCILYRYRWSKTFSHNIKLLHLRNRLSLVSLVLSCQYDVSSESFRHGMRVLSSVILNDTALWRWIGNSTFSYFTEWEGNPWAFLIRKSRRSQCKTQLVLSEEKETEISQCTPSWQKTATVVRVGQSEMATSTFSPPSTPWFSEEKKEYRV